MRYLLDTMVLSEPARPQPDAGVLEWLRVQAPPDLAVSVLTFGEVAHGVARMPDGKRKTALRNWLSTDLRERFGERMLPVDEQVALVWGELTAEGERIGRRLHVVDGLLLATARVHDLTLVTRNVGDFTDRGVPIHNPWSSVRGRGR